MNYQKQATDFLTKAGATIKIELAKQQQAPLWHKDGQDYGLMYNITIERPNHKPWSFNFWDSIHNKENKKTPTAYDILATITKYDPGDFENFCAEYGYDTDSRTAEKTFLAVNKEWHAVNNMFGDLLEKLEEIN